MFYRLVPTVTGRLPALNSANKGAKPLSHSTPISRPLLGNMKALIFDLDGTLVDSVYAHTLAWQQTLREYESRPPHLSFIAGLALAGDCW